MAQFLFRPIVPALFAVIVGGTASLWAADEDYVASSPENQRPMLGIEMTPTTQSAQDANGLDPYQGVQVQAVYSGTAADGMGLQKDDVVLAVNGQPISSMTDLRNEVSLSGVGEPIEVTVARNGQVVHASSDVKPWPEHIPYEKLDAAAEKRFRDFQDRRAQRTADDLARAGSEIERLRRKLSGEVVPDADGTSTLAGGMAFRFRYALESDRLASASPLPVADADAVSPVIDPAVADGKPWKLSVDLSSH